MHILINMIMHSIFVFIKSKCSYRSFLCSQIVVDTSCCIPVTWKFDNVIVLA